MKIVTVLGSPRNSGNTEIIAQKFLDEAKKKGAEIKSFSLSKMNYKGCIACMGCKGKQEKCVVKDDLQQVLEAVRECDLLIMATPVYYGDVTSQMKGFVDRTFSYMVPDFISNPKPSRLKPGKKCLFILAQGQPDEKMFSDIYPKYSGFFKWYGFETFLIRGIGLGNKGDAAKREDLMKQAVELAQQIVK